MPRVTKPDCIEVGEGPLGRGVFATQAIAAGEIVEICPTLESQMTRIGAPPRLRL